MCIGAYLEAGSKETPRKKWYRRAAPPSAKPPVPQQSSRLTQLAITTAPVVFVLLWSTGFIGARYGLPYIEPLTFLAVRMVFVVVLMAVIAAIGGARFPSQLDIAHSLAAGALVHGLYLGGVFIAISQGVPAGISALIPGLQPILISTIANRFMGETCLLYTSPSPRD